MDRSDKETESPDTRFDEKAYSFEDIGVDMSLDEQREIEDSIDTTSLVLDGALLKDFYARSSNAVSDIGKLIITADVIMRNLSNEDIEKCIKYGRTKFEGLGILQMEKMMANLSLMSLLATARLNYLCGEEREKKEGNGDKNE